MSDIQLFRLNGGIATELTSGTAPLEKALQHLVENQMETLLGVRFLAAEYATGKTHRGRIDSLGLDENGCPVIVEYKRHSHENVMNQGLLSGLAHGPPGRGPLAGDGKVRQGSGR
jgi:RecB family endonuclease NucS